MQRQQETQTNYLLRKRAVYVSATINCGGIVEDEMRRRDILQDIADSYRSIWRLSSRCLLFDDRLQQQSTALLRYFLPFLPRFFFHAFSG